MRAKEPPTCTPPLRCFFYSHLFVPSRNLSAWNRLWNIKPSQYTNMSFIFAETTLANQNLRYVIEADAHHFFAVHSSLSCHLNCASNDSFCLKVNLRLVLFVLHRFRLLSTCNITCKELLFEGK